MTNAANVSFGLETLKGVSAKLAMYGFGFVATAYFARELGPATFGGFFLLLSVVQFANRIPHGIGGACQKRLAETETSNDELLGLTLGVWVASGLVVALLAVAGRAHLTAYTGVSNAASLGVGLFVAISLFLPLQFLLAGTGKFGVTNWIDLLREIVKTGLQFGLVALGFGVTGMTAGFVAATLLTVPVILFFLGVRPSLPSRDTAAYVWEYARYNVPSNVVGKAYTRFDIFLLGAIGLTAGVGYYEVALSLTGLATLISGVVMDGLISKTSNLSSRGRSIADSVTATISYTSVIAIPMLVLVAFLGEPIVRAVYGAEYLAAVPYLLGIAAYRVVQTQREPLDSAVKGMGRPDAVFRISTVTVAVNFVLGVALVLTVGAIGVVVATVVAETVRCLLLHRALRRNDTVVPVFPAPLRAQFRSALAMAAVMVVLTVTLPAAVAAPLVVTGGLGLATYLGTVLAQDGVARAAIARAAVAVHALATGAEVDQQTTH
ncbi:lipopolysaccharide biosynthesis protein [Natrinema sp. 74]|uniref:lipopolysaccharide biosynthesis protein n=1 Tax=Natrinema sp. 74 TaxID=3384159 RepID=UPI0038D440D4